MRFMMLVIPKGYETAAPDAVPDAKARRADDEIQRRSGESRRPARARRAAPRRRLREGVVQGGKPSVTDGPFAEAKEAVGGYWIIQVKSKEEAIEWAKRAPMGDNEIIEVRQVQEMSDFPPDVRPRPPGSKRCSAKSSHCDVIGGCECHRNQSHDRCDLEDRIAEAHRVAGAHDA